MLKIVISVDCTLADITSYHYNVASGHIFERARCRFHDCLSVLFVVRVYCIKRVQEFSKLVNERNDIRPLFGESKFAVYQRCPLIIDPSNRPQLGELWQRCRVWPILTLQRWTGNAVRCISVDVLPVLADHDNVAKRASFIFIRSGHSIKVHSITFLGAMKTPPLGGVRKVKL